MNIIWRKNSKKKKKRVQRISTNLVFQYYQRLLHIYYQVCNLLFMARRNYLQILIYKPVLKLHLRAAKITTRIQQIKCIQGIYQREGSSDLLNLLLLAAASIKCEADAANRWHSINLLVS